MLVSEHSTPIPAVPAPEPEEPPWRGPVAQMRALTERCRDDGEREQLRAKIALLALSTVAHYPKQHEVLLEASEMLLAAGLVEEGDTVLSRLLALGLEGAADAHALAERMEQVDEGLQKRARAEELDRNGDANKRDSMTEVQTAHWFEEEATTLQPDEELTRPVELLARARRRPAPAEPPAIAETVDDEAPVVEPVSDAPAEATSEPAPPHAIDDGPTEITTLQQTPVPIPIPVHATPDEVAEAPVVVSTELLRPQSSPDSLVAPEPVADAPAASPDDWSRVGVSNHVLPTSQPPPPLGRARSVALALAFLVLVACILVIQLASVLSAP